MYTVHGLICSAFNSLRRRRNRRHIADDSFKCIFWNENVWLSIKISLKFVPRHPINIIQALVQILAWRRPVNKPLCEPMMVSLVTQIYVTRPQLVKRKDYLNWYWSNHTICHWHWHCPDTGWRHKLEHFPRYWPFVRGIHRSFDVFFDLRLNKRLSKQSWGWWYETSSRPLWRHNDEKWMK